MKKALKITKPHYSKNIFHSNISFIVYVAFIYFKWQLFIVKKARGL